MKHIAFKLWIGMMALVVTMLAMLWTFQIAFFQDGYLQGKASYLTAQATMLSALITKDSAEAMEYITMLSDTYNANAMVINAEGSVIYASADYAGAIMADCIAKTPVLQNGGSFSDYIVREKYALRYVRSGVPVTGGGALFLIMPVSDVSGTVAILKGQFFYLSIMMTSAAVIIATMISRLITKPISQLKIRAMRMSEGDLETPFIVTTCDEIGDLTRTMEQLRQSLHTLERLRRELVANITHELRTPLAIIRGFAETVKDVTYKDDEKRERQLTAIIDESQRLERMVNEILDYSQLQAGALKYDKKRVCLSETCERVTGKMGEYFQRGSIILEQEIAPEVYVNGDDGKLEQVLFNLLANAFNHSPEDTKVTLRLKASGDIARVEVQDEGEGIPKEDLPHIWDRYYRAAIKDREKRIGSGLGLAMCKSILEAHDARYGVESTVGVGSLFAFELKKCK